MLYRSSQLSFRVRHLQIYGLLGSRRGIHIDSAPLAIEADLSVDKGKDRVVTSQANAAAREELGTPLSDYDVSGQHMLAAKLFDSESLADAVSTVFD